MNALPQPLLAAILDRMPVARLAVLDNAERPDAMPIVFARVGTTLFSPIDGKPKKHARLARLEHIRRHPAITLVLDHYAPDWKQLWWLRLEADAGVAVGEHPQWARAVQALQDKYPQYGETALFSGPPTMIVMPWQRVRWWAADGLAGIETWLARSS